MVLRVADPAALSDWYVTVLGCRVERVLPDFDALVAGAPLDPELPGVDFPNDRDPEELAPWLDRLAPHIETAMVRVPGGSSGRS